MDSLTDSGRGAAQEERVNVVCGRRVPFGLTGPGCKCGAVATEVCIGGELGQCVKCSCRRMYRRHHRTNGQRKEQAR
jgi:hypothetical protein